MKRVYYVCQMLMYIDSRTLLQYRTQKLDKKLRYVTWDITQFVCIFWFITHVCIYHQETLTKVYPSLSLLGYNHSWKTDQYHQNFHDSTHWGYNEITTCVSRIRQTDKITVLSEPERVVSRMFTVLHFVVLDMKLSFLHIVIA